MFECRACGNTDYFIEGLETFWIGWGVTQFWCAPIIKCCKCSSFLEPRYETGIRVTGNKVEHETIARRKEIVDNRTKYLNYRPTRCFEKPKTWS